MDQSKILNITRRFLWVFVLAALIAGLTTYLTFSSKPTLYEANTKLLVGPGLDSPSPDLNSLRIGGQLVQTYAELVTSRPFLESLNDKLNNKVSPEALSQMIEIKQNTDTRILTIVVRDRDPNQAVAIANAIAQDLIALSPAIDNTTSSLRMQIGNQSQQLEQIVNNSQTRIQELEERLIGLGNVDLPSPEAAQANLEQKNLVINQLADERARLSDALRTLATVYTVLRDTNTNQLQIIEPAEAVFPVDENVLLRVAASALAGLILAVSVVFASEHYSDTIRLPEDFRRAAKAPLLSTIEKHGRLNGTGPARIATWVIPDSPAANSYRMAVAKLLISMGKSLPYTFLLSSVGAKSGEDTADTVANLGVAFAQAGKRVVLVDAQIHNPRLTELFEATDKPGLAEFLAANTPKLKLIPAKDISGLQVLPSGVSSEKSWGAALNSEKIAALIDELHKEADFILVAGAPVTRFAESLAVASEVDGVILVSQAGEAHAATVNEVVETLRAMNVNLVGVIFDNNQPPFTLNLKPKTAFESSRVAPEDSHI